MVVEEDECKEEDFEMILFAIAVIATIMLGYRNKGKIKKMFNTLVGHTE